MFEILLRKKKKNKLIILKSFRLPYMLPRTVLYIIADDPELIKREKKSSRRKILRVIVHIQQDDLELINYRPGAPTALTLFNALKSSLENDAGAILCFDGTTTKNEIETSLFTYKFAVKKVGETESNEILLLKNNKSSMFYTYDFFDKEVEIELKPKSL